MRELWELYRTFFTIGALTFGGGYAMLPMLERELVEKHQWVTQEEILNYFAIGQCTPGVIAVNTATFVGFKRRRVIGGITTTLGVISPSIIIITVIAMLLSNFMDIVWVQHAFAGIRVAVCALILASVVKLFKSNVKRWWHWPLAFAAFLTVSFGLSPVWVVAATAVLGLLLGRKVNLHA
ncbi:MAG: chromate transporter [Christensenellaceae bacterium]|nr:chromate transporter [Christensenellaceae bacterium]